MLATSTKIWSRTLPNITAVRRHIEAFMNAKEVRVLAVNCCVRPIIDVMSQDDRNQDELVKQVKPLLERTEGTLQETNGEIKGADPDNRLR